MPWDNGRDPAVDLVRGIAVVCMVVAHVRVWAPTDAVPVRAALLVVNNVASPLFALVMGVSAGVVLTRARRPVAGRTFVLRNLVRGVILIAIGVALEQLHTFVAIVLQSLGATLVVAAPLTLLSATVLTGLAVVTFAAGPAVNAAARAVLDPARVSSDAWVDQVLQWFVLSTHYRVVSLLPFVLIGVVLARRGLSRRVAVGSLVVGVLAGVAVVGLWLTGTGIGRSEVVSGDLTDSLLDLALTGCAFGAIVLLARWPRASSAVTAMAPVRAVGALALTSYVLHVALIALVTRTVDWQARADHWPLLAGGILVGTVLACWMWWRLVGRGPVERLMAVATDRIT
ncbi:acyltransferase family protein [Janibacter alittae]|uniref:Acyltransferase family protein n=1 Tax=Janibacter alittae TaxID=3115209 RepID=A0ABZ2MGP7_9MICO